MDFTRELSAGDWGNDSGYFYISYYDEAINKFMTLFTAENKSNYDSVYYYDAFGATKFINMVGTTTSSFGNVFPSFGNETIRAAGVYTYQAGAEFEAEVHLNPDDGPENSTAGAVSVVNGTFDLPGYHTVDFDTPVEISSDGTFSVIFTVTNPSSISTIPIEQKIENYTSAATSAPGDSYYLAGNGHWADAYDLTGFDRPSICIKAYTTFGHAVPAPVANFTAAPLFGTLPLIVQFNDTSDNSPTSWSWDFGDGNISYEQNPVYAYTITGKYNVTLTATNDGGTDSVTKTDYINVLESPPYADFSGTPLTGDAPLSVTFTEESTGDIQGLAWYFGDENYSQPWVPVTWSAEWSDRYFHSLVSFPDGSMYVLGGKEKFNYANDVWRSDDGGSSWSEVNGSAGWDGRQAFTATAMPDGSIVMMGGTDGSNKNDVWRSADEGLTWTEMTAGAEWSARYGHASVVLSDGSIVLTGGISSTELDDVWKSADNGATWTEINSSPGWSARRGHSTTVLPDGSILLSGGYDGSTSLNDVWISEDGGVTWTEQTAGAEWPARTYHNSEALADGSVILFGGYYLSDVWRSADNGVSWERLSSLAEWSKRVGGKSTILPNGNIVITGGHGYQGVYLNLIDDVWCLKTAVSDEKNPKHTYLIPGTYPVTLQAFNDGGRTAEVKYDYITVTGTAPPVTNTTAPDAEFSGVPDNGSVPLLVQFTDESTGDAPTGWAWYFGDENYSESWTEMTAAAGWKGRVYQSAVAMPDGSVVLTGGYTDSWDGSYHVVYPLNDTWRSTDYGATWSILSDSSGWSARYGHGTVVTDDGDILLIGGAEFQDNKQNNDVWSSADNGETWNDINSSAGFAGRHQHSVVALPDGNIVLMAGQAGNGNEFNKNDTWLSADNGETWTEMTGGAEWEARSGQTAVALPDGSIVLMGGTTATGAMNDVWRSTDKGATWTEVNSSAGWQKRYIHNSVALPDGSILLMGGYTGSVVSNVRDVWSSSDNGATWTKITEDAEWSRRSGSSSVVMPDGSVLIMAGGANDYKNNVWRMVTAGSSEQNPAHLYTSEGIYDVALQAYNSGGFGSLLEAGYITAGGTIAPVANFTASPLSGTAPLSVQFNDTSENEPTEWSWDFGDGNTSTVQNPSYIYRAPGAYNVTLAVANAAGTDTITKSDFVTVSGPSVEAEFDMNRNFVAFSDNNTFPAGTYTANQTYRMHAENRDLAAVLGDLVYTAGVANITSVEYSPFAAWNSTYAEWNFPSIYAIGPGSSFDTRAYTSYTEERFYNHTITRVCNTSVFRTPGVQGTNITVVFNDLDFESVFVGFGAAKDLNMTAEIINLSVVTNAPLAVPLPPGGDYHLKLDKSALTTGTEYYFSFSTLITPNATAVIHKPIAYVWEGISHDSEDLGTVYKAEVPAAMLPSDATGFSIETNTSCDWSFTWQNNDLSVIEGRSLIINTTPPVADFSASPVGGIVPLTVTFTDSSENDPTSWTWDFLVAR